MEILPFCLRYNRYGKLSFSWSFKKSLPENHASFYLVILESTLIITLTYYEMRPSFTYFTEIFWWIQNASHFPKWNSNFNDGNNGLKPFKNVAKYGVEVNAKKWIISFVYQIIFFFKNRKPNSLKNYGEKYKSAKFSAHSMMYRWWNLDILWFLFWEKNGVQAFQNLDQSHLKATRFFWIVI